jgi:hypothetical protein
MKEPRTEHDQSIRVLLLGGGPVLERSVKQFISRLEDHPEIEFIGGFIQSKTWTFVAAVKDLFRRRHLLAIPVLILQLAETLSRYLFQPVAEIKLNRKINAISARLHYVPDIHADDVLNRTWGLDIAVPF